MLRIVVGECDCRCCSVGHRRRQAQAGSGRARLRARGGAPRPRRGRHARASTESSAPGSRPSRCPGARRTDLCPGRQRFGRGCRLSGVDASDRQDRCCAGGDDGLTARVARSRLSSAVAIATWSVAGGNRHECATEERPGQRLRVPGQATGFDRGVEELGGLGQPPEHAPRHAEGRVDSRKQLVLAGCASDLQRAFGSVCRPPRSGRDRSPRRRDRRGRRAGERDRRLTGRRSAPLPRIESPPRVPRRRPMPVRGRRSPATPRRGEGRASARDAATARAAQSWPAAYCKRKTASRASSIISPTASAPAASASESSAVTRRAWA